MNGETFYDFSARLIDGREIPMSIYRGKTVLVVNTASKCGFTPQYAGLQRLYDEFGERGFVVLAFPCNQFARQEPGTEAEIGEFCRVNYGVTFPLFSKIEVNGKNAHPLFLYLKSKLPGFPGKKIKWNFTKFLISPQGIALKRFPPTTETERLRDEIVKQLPGG